MCPFRKRIFLASLLLGFVQQSAIAQNTVDWDASSLRMLQADAGYPRMIRLDDRGTLLFSFERGGRSFVRRSEDDGKTWGDAVMVAQSDWGSCANPQPVALQDGHLLLFFNGRPNRRSGHAFTIELARSDDGGRTWTRDGAPIFEAGNRFGAGCYEPAAVQGADGSIRLYFANEQPHSAEGSQEITSLLSADDGKTWHAPRVVSFRPRHRDGMPIPAILKNGKTLVAIEDNGWRNDPRLRATLILDEPDARDPAKPVGGDDERRWFATTDLQADDTGSAAPFLVVDPHSGRTALSCQLQSSDHPRPTMLVLIGDADGRQFGGSTLPFDASRGSATTLPVGTSQQWNSLCFHDDGRLVALAGIEHSGKGDVWSIEGTINVSPVAPTK